MTQSQGMKKAWRYESREPVRALSTPKICVALLQHRQISVKLKLWKYASISTLIIRTSLKARCKARIKT